MEKLRKLELIQRCLGLRHKLKVHESMKAPDNHEDLSLMLLTRWEFEDELHAIEEILNEARSKNVTAKRSLYEKDDFGVEPEAEADGNRSPEKAPVKAEKKRSSKK